MKQTTILLGFSLLLLATACGKHEDPILRLSAVEALELGKDYLEQGKYFRARQHLTHAFEVEPNSRSGREALLLAADAFYLDGGSENFVKCEAKYRDFLNRFPTSDRADYAQFQVAQCLAERVEKPDRDQKVTREALRAYEELLRLYPTSEYVAQTRQKIQEISDLLAAHELAIGSFYVRYGRRGICHATIGRLADLQETYPAFSQMDAVHYYLGVAYQRCQRPAESALEFEKLKRDYPDSKYLDKMTSFRKKQRKSSQQAAGKSS